MVWETQLWGALGAMRGKVALGSPVLWGCFIPSWEERARDPQVMSAFPWGGKTLVPTSSPPSPPPRLMNKLQPNSVRKINRSALNWHQVGASSPQAFHAPCNCNLAVLCPLLTT